MPILRVNAEEGRPVAPDGSALDECLAAALAALPPGAPIVVMIHGYKYTPGTIERCPHRSIFADTPVSVRPKRCRSWPRAMGFDGTRPDEGLCIPFGWDAGGTIWRAAAATGMAAHALRALLAAIARQSDRPAHILAHSLGARVALAALPGLPRGAVGRTVLLHAAEFRSRARTALSTSAGATTEIVNITTRENDLFDGLFRFFLAPHRLLDPALSAGLGTQRPNWLDIRIDEMESRAALALLGFDIPAPERRVCHWSAYMREGMFELHSALLRAPDRTPLAGLAACLPDGARRGPLERALARIRSAYGAHPLPASAQAPS